LIADRYADPDVIAALRRHQVEVPDEAECHVNGPFQTHVPLPVPATLFRELHVDIGLSSITSPCSSGWAAWPPATGSSRPACRSDHHEGAAHGTGAVIPALNTQWPGAA
jgi:hypothetical protein